MPINEGLMRLRREPLHDDLFDQVGRTFREPMVAISEELFKSMGENPEVFRAVMTTDADGVTKRLEAFLPSDESRDTLRWVMGFLQSLMDIVAMTLTTTDLSKVAMPPDVERSPGLRVIIALMAANDEARDGGDPGRVDELIDYAFLESVKLRNEVQAAGLVLNPFPREDERQRRARIKSVAAWMRGASTEADDVAMDLARMRNIR